MRTGNSPVLLRLKPLHRGFAGSTLYVNLSREGNQEKPVCET
jgi:hypothetical protein